MNKKQALYASAITVGINTPRAKTQHAEETAKMDAFREGGFDPLDYAYWSSIRLFAQNNLASLASEQAPSEIAAAQAPGRTIADALRAQASPPAAIPPSTAPAPIV